MSFKYNIFLYSSSVWWMEILLLDRVHQDGKKRNILFMIVYKVIGIKGAAKTSLGTSHQWSRRGILEAWVWRGSSS